MRRLALLLCLLALAAPVAAQDAAPAVESAAADASITTVSAAQEDNGLPPVAPPPRTLRAYWHVFVAFAVAWGLLFGYAIFIARRSGALEKQIKRLEGSGA